MPNYLITSSPHFHGLFLPVFSPPSSRPWKALLNFPRDYIKKMLRRDAELKSKWGTICPPVEMLAPDGKRRKTQAADLEQLFRLIQSVPSKKVEPVKQWLAQLGSQRIDQMIDPANYGFLTGS